MSLPIFKPFFEQIVQKIGKTCKFFNISMLSLCFLLHFEGVTLEMPHKIFREKTLFFLKKRHFFGKIEKNNDVVLLKNTQNEFFLRPCTRNKRF